MKKILTVLLMLALVITLIPTALAENDPIPLDLSTSSNKFLK